MMMAITVRVVVRGTVVVTTDPYVVQCWRDFYATLYVAAEVSAAKASVSEAMLVKATASGVESWTIRQPWCG